MTQAIMIRPTVAEYLDAQIEACGKDEASLARELGYEEPQVIAMMRRGQAKVPVSEVSSLATAIDADPAYLLRLVLTEYMPETWAAIEETLAQTVLTRNELELIQAFRQASRNSDAQAVFCTRDVVAVVMV